MGGGGNSGGQIGEQRDMESWKQIAGRIIHKETEIYFIKYLDLY